MTTMASHRIPSLLHTLTDDVLSPSPARRELAERRYRDLAAYLERHMGAKLECKVWVYPQGSYRLGTTLVNPVTGEFDVDIVIAYDLSRGDITKQELVAQMHGWLVRYCQGGHGGGDLDPSGYDGTKRRAFTLEYPDNFHMDVLVVVLEKPAPPATIGQPSWLPDLDLYNWQPTNPRGFGEHFDRASAAQRIELAKAASVEIDELPRLGVKTSLQRAVMLFKRHRDVMYADAADDLAPHSALITAMSTASFLSCSELEPSIPAIARGLTDQVQFRNGDLWVPNPTWVEGGVELENYADRYAGRPDKVRELRRWVAAIQDDLAAFHGAHDLPTRAAAISKAFGDGLGERTASAHGRRTAGHAANVGLHASSAGLALGAANYTRPTFHGDAR